METSFETDMPTLEAGANVQDTPEASERGIALQQLHQRMWMEGVLIQLDAQRRTGIKPNIRRIRPF